jgi:hypothetical protein
MHLHAVLVSLFSFIPTWAATDFAYTGYKNNDTSSPQRDSLLKTKEMYLLHSMSWGV